MKVIIGIWLGILVLYVVATTEGPEALQTWARDHASVLSALLVAAITSIYVGITREQLNAQRQLLQLEFGAGAYGPSIELLRIKLDIPPAIRIDDSYEYPNEYMRTAIPNVGEQPLDATTEYEVIRIKNRGKNPIANVSLSLRVIHDRKKKLFSYCHSEQIGPGEQIDISIWPTKFMPKYKLVVQGEYTDAVGGFPLAPQEVER